MKSGVPLLLLVACTAFGQTRDTVTITHTYYSTTFDTVRHFPVVVKYWLTRRMLDCDARIKRKNTFKPDPALPGPTNLAMDYKGSGYDRGHNMPAEDNRCDPAGMRECFYYSNMTPQTHSLNAGAWKTLEEHERAETLKWDSVLVWCGSVAVSGKQIGRVAVPDYCWKVIFVVKEKVTEAYSFGNDTSPSRPIESYRVSIDSVRHLSGMDPFSP